MRRDHIPPYVYPGRETRRRMERQARVRKRLFIGGILIAGAWAIWRCFNV